MTEGSPGVHLSRAGVSLVLTPDPSQAPLLQHWGAALGDLTADDLAGLAALRRPGISMSAVDVPRQLTLVPDAVSGFTGTPALEGHRIDEPGAPWAPRLTGWEWSVDDAGEDARADFRAEDAEAGWAVTVQLELTVEGVVRSRTRVRNTGPGRLHLAAARSVLPVGAHATELLDLTGRWCRERVPQRHQWVQGTWSRHARHGRPGHDASLLLVAGTPGFDFGTGEVWGVHVGWSGNHTTYAERTPEGECLLGGGELLSPGEVVLDEGEEYVSPWLFGARSEDGLDGMSHRLHQWLRRHSPRTREPGPVLANTWEAVYFDHRPDRVGALAEAASAVGVERFVLDDGWFLNRKDDRRGLGDWTVDRTAWPDGLGPLVTQVQDLGMEFGLWVEPEMVNVDSDVIRAHPEWVLRGRDQLPLEWRHQQVLDLQQPPAYSHVRDSLRALLREHDIAFLKWDHNRDLIDVMHDGRAAVHGQTLAVYRLLDELREEFPDVTIESCASGGGRIDLGILTRTDRVWASDTVDALERQHIQRWTSLLVPPELIGSHIGGPVAHTTGRAQRLGFRAGTAVLYSFGIEWNLADVDEATRRDVGAWVTLHKRIRPLLPTGRLVHPDHADPAVLVTGLVGADRREAWYVVAVTGATQTQHAAPVRLTGLDPALRYRVSRETPTLDQHGMDLGETWTQGEGVVVPGAVLIGSGIGIPVPAPDTAHVFRAVAQPTGGPVDGQEVRR